MRYSIEPNYRRYVKGYGFLLFARKFGDKYGKKLMKTVTKKELMQQRKIGGKYGKDLMDTAKIYETNFAKTAG